MQKENKHIITFFKSDNVKLHWCISCTYKVLYIYILGHSAKCFLSLKWSFRTYKLEPSRKLLNVACFFLYHPKAHWLAASMCDWPSLLSLHPCLTCLTTNGCWVRSLLYLFKHMKHCDRKVADSNKKVSRSWLKLHRLELIWRNKSSASEYIYTQYQMRECLLTVATGRRDVQKNPTDCGAVPMYDY